MKILSMLLIGMLLMSIMPLAFAQESLAVEIPAGDSTVVDLVDSDVSASVDKAGLVSQIGALFERFVDFAGVRVWKEESNTLVENYDVYAFPAGTPTPIFAEIVDLGLAETSEDVLIRGQQGIWTTNNVVSTVAGTEMAVQDLGTLFLHDNGDSIGINAGIITIDGGLSYSRIINEVPSQKNGVVRDCTDGLNLCPTTQEVEDNLGIIPTQMAYMIVDFSESETDLGLIVLIEQPALTWQQIADLNQDGSFDFGTDYFGTKTSSIGTQVLSILDVSAGNVFDVYGVI